MTFLSESIPSVRFSVILSLEFSYPQKVVVMMYDKVSLYIARIDYRGVIEARCPALQRRKVLEERLASEKPRCPEN